MATDLLCVQTRVDLDTVGHAGQSTQSSRSFVLFAAHDALDWSVVLALTLQRHWLILVIYITDLHAGQGESESPHKLVVWLQEEQMIIDKMLAELHNYQKLSRAVTDHWSETQRSDANAQHQVLIGRHGVATEITIRLTLFYRLLSNYHSRTYLSRLLSCADHVICSDESHLHLTNVGRTVRSRGDSVAAR